MVVVVVFVGLILLLLLLFGLFLEAIYIWLLQKRKKKEQTSGSDSTGRFCSCKSCGKVTVYSRKTKEQFCRKNGFIFIFMLLLVFVVFCFCLFGWLVGWLVGWMFFCFSDCYYLKLNLTYGLECVIMNFHQRVDTTMSRTKRVLVTWCALTEQATVDIGVRHNHSRVSK